MNNEKREWGTLFCTSGFIIMVIFLILGMVDHNYSFIGLCGVIVGCILVLIGLIINKIDQVNNKEETRNSIEKNKKEMSDWFDSKIAEYNVKTDDIIAIRKKEYSINVLRKYYYWMRDKKLFFFPQKENFIWSYVTVNNSVEYCEENAKLISINISDIEYFKLIGDISYVTNVESTGINIKGAAIGAVIAGDSGAIIGSRPQIKSKIEEKDNRFVELKYKDNGTITTMRFDYIALDIFRNIFPEKEYEYAEFKVKNLDEKDDEIEMDFTLEERFEKLKRLKNAGLITEEEFTDKKKELLQQI